MATKEKERQATGGLGSVLPIDRLRDEARGLGEAAIGRSMSAASDKVTSMTNRLTDVASGGGSVKAEAAKKVAKGDSPLKAAVTAGASKVKDTVKETLGMGGGSGQDKMKVTNIVEEIDVPVARKVAYDAWTQFEEFPDFMKKVENVSQEDDTTLQWKAQIFWSHRSWKSTIVEQIPDERIVWKSEGEKGKVDGAVTFHELAPDLTRILMVLEYHPQGLFERTGNIWRAQGRRARLELKHFRRHLMTQTILNQEEVDGWRGTIEDEEVVSESDENSDGKSDGKSEGKSDEKSAGKSDEKDSDSKKSSNGRSRTTSKKSSSASSSRSKGSSAKATKKSSSSSSGRKKSASRQPAKKSSARKRTQSA